MRSPVLDRTLLGWPCSLPFIGMLLTIALGPLLFPRIWSRHYGKFAVAWSALTATAIAVTFGIGAAFDALLNMTLLNYMSFIALLFSLYVVAGGIVIVGNFHGTPAGNAGMLLFGVVLASFVGTTGAAMIAARPLIRANEHRQHNAHVFVFAIFPVANVGGVLTPLGNPPLFVGFLHGVDFFWPAQHLFSAATLVVVIILAMFVLVDAWYYRREHHEVLSRHRSNFVAIRLRGLSNVYLLGCVIAAILLSAAWKPGTFINVRGTALESQNLIRDMIIVIVAIISLRLTPEEHREANGFSWEPIREVAILFGAIFVCIIPVLAMLSAGARGGFAWMLALTSAGGTTNNLAYFWLSGILSSVLDNAPTYLMFFDLAGGDAHQLMGPFSATLAAISLGASSMAALTYIGNAPNLIIYAIAVERGIAMPSFFGFTVWSSAILLPVLGIVGWAYFG